MDFIQVTAMFINLPCVFVVLYNVKNLIKYGHIVERGTETLK